MPRLARIVAPGYPHHVTQRGNRRQTTFFRDDDYREYIALMSEWRQKCGVDVWAYCLMPNHVHFIVLPYSEDGLRRMFSEAHKRYSRSINFREGWRGCLWQGRFSSYVMDEKWLVAAARYVEMNPVRAGLAEKPWDWPWSSAAAHVEGRDDTLCKTSPLLDMITRDWKTFLAADLKDEERKALRGKERTGRPLGSDEFVEHLESLLSRPLKKGKPGRKPKVEDKGGYK